MAEMATTSKKVNVKRKEEDRIIKIFLDWYNNRNRTNYEVTCRPENKTEARLRNIEGTYDYLCKENNGKGSELAVEITRLYKDEQNVQQNVELEKLQSLILKGLKIKQGYDLEIRFKKHPPSREFKHYVDEINKFAVTKFNKCHRLGRSFQSKISECSLIEYIRISPKDLGSGVSLWILLAGNELRGEEPIANALLQVLNDNQSKLQVAKKHGKTTILLISHQFLPAGIEELKRNFHLLSQNEHYDIDQVYVLDENNFDNRPIIEILK